MTLIELIARECWGSEESCREAIVCRGCGRRLFNDDGIPIKNPAPWWQFWKWAC